MRMVSLVASLGRVIEDTLRPLVPPDRPLAIVDFPNYPNVGDSAIYLGQLACLRALGLRAPRFICDLATYDRHALAGAVRSGTILLTGGGSLGDLWAPAQACREDIVRNFPGNRIVQLPQSVHFRSAAALRQARSVFDAHPDLTLLLRDARSLDTARNEFRARSLLCPDMAFALGPLRRPAPATRDIVWLARSDQESASPVPDAAQGLRTDWLDEPLSPLLRLNYFLMGATRRPGLARWSRPLLRRTYSPLARQRLTRGLRILSGGEVVITDRLHGHILALLLGIPNVILDNSYGKLSSFHEAWTAAADDVHFAASPADALRIATAIAVAGRTSTARGERP